MRNPCVEFSVEFISSPKELADVLDITVMVPMQAKTACVIRDEQEIQLPIEDVLVGDTVIVRPGEKVPVDGIISSGRSALDELMISGELMPVNKGPGDEAVGATLNKEGMIKFEATKIGKNTTLAQIVRLVQAAQGSKAPVSKIRRKSEGILFQLSLG